ncbi:serine/threonine-protein kinase [Planomonospora sp. ID82291]|uniref:serine/threonine-protein kinase n=1 Tax=Planomonospora sp. ID82291 TaxID=2738136 RepID=UPI0018C3FAFF|nr:serine/threonine-protein kinase [Planomonospora sp. ID82291]MBG0817782.1 protein kinase [Planomonospora sp. ID82291]
MPPGVRPLTVGDPVVIGRHLLLGRLGAGGMGVVYLAEHPYGGVVAIKTPHPVHLDDPTLRARFAEEVEFSRRVVPFCTAAVIEDGTDRERPYLVCEYVPGPALSQVVSARGPLTPDLAYGIALGVAAALTAVHEAGLVHRDLKPANVLLSPTGPRVIDFGIARDIARDIAGGANGLAALTQAGQVMGSPGWVAPERLTGGRALPPSDVFSWGCLVAYAATGHHPFGAGEPDALARRILVEPPRLCAVPALLRPVVEAALDKEPARRPPAADLLGALLAVGGVGDPWDLRVAVAEVLAEIWTPVPYPQEEGNPDPPRARPAAGPADRSRNRPRVHERPEAPVRGTRRAARDGAHLPQAGFAALATASMAVLAVLAAGNGGLGEGTDRPPEHVPMVVPADGTPTGGAFRRTRPPAGEARTVPPVGPSTITVTTTRTSPVPQVSGHAEERVPDGPRDPAEPSDEPGGGAPGEPQTCADGEGRAAARDPGEDCPPDTAAPRPSFTRIPQTGDGESPSPSPSATATASPSPSSSGPVPQIGD